MLHVGRGSAPRTGREPRLNGSGLSWVVSYDRRTCAGVVLLPGRARTSRTKRWPESSAGERRTGADRAPEERLPPRRIFIRPAGITAGIALPPSETAWPAPGSITTSSAAAAGRPRRRAAIVLA